MRGVWLVFKKEVLELSKDRKTLFVTLLLPIILYPMLFGFIGKMVKREERQARSSQTRIALIDPSGAIEQLIKSKPLDFELVPPPEDDPKQAIKDEKLEMLVTLEPSAAQDIVEHKTVAIDVLYNRVEKSGRVGMQRLEDAIQEMDKTIIQERLKKLGASAQLALPTEIQSRQVGGQEMMLAKQLGTMLPYMLMLMLFAGSMQLGIYVTAGERERGTLITLLATGLPRHEIVWGKLCYIFIMGIVNSAINIAAMSFSMGSMVGQISEAATEAAAVNGAVAPPLAGLAAVADPAVIVLTLLLMIPLGLTFSNLIIFVGIQAKNSQEAGTWMMPIFLPIIFLALFSMMPGIEKMPFLTYVPILNVSLVIRKLFAQQASGFEYLIAFWMTVGLAALLTLLSTKFLNRESALFKNT